MRQVGGVETWYNQHSCPQVDDPQTGRESQLHSSLKGAKGSYIGLPSPGVLHWEDKPPECFILKASVPYFWESQRTGRNRDSTLKRWAQNLTHSKTQGRSNNLKGVWVRPTCWSWRASWSVRRHLGLPLGRQTLEEAIWGTLSYHKDTGAGRCHSGVLPLAN